MVPTNYTRLDQADGDGWTIFKELMKIPQTSIPTLEFDDGWLQSILCWFLFSKIAEVSSQGFYLRTSSNTELIKNIRSTCYINPYIFLAITKNTFDLMSYTNLNDRSFLEIDSCSEILTIFQKCFSSNFLTTTIIHWHIHVHVWWGIGDSVLWMRKVLAFLNLVNHRVSRKWKEMLN